METARAKTGETKIAGHPHRNSQHRFFEGVGSGDGDGGNAMRKRIQSLAAEQLLALLAEKHAADVFVPECKDGPSQGTQHFRMDAWAMLKSWSNPLTIGYEIK